jgi:hypothetical protein
MNNDCSFSYTPEFKSPLGELLNKGFCTGIPLESKGRKDCQLSGISKLATE